MEVKDGVAQFERSSDEAGKSMSDGQGKRQCPVPKPGGMLGEMLGFHKPKAPAMGRDTDRRSDEKT